MMFCDLQPARLYDNVHELLRMAYPGCEITMEAGRDAGVCFSLRLDMETDQVMIWGKLRSPDGEVENQACYPLVTGTEPAHQAQKHVRYFTYQLLHRHLGRDVNAYGILTGMRPVKLAHRMLDQDLPPGQVERLLQEDYLLQLDKARLLTEIAGNNRPYLHTTEEARHLASIYIGIPYCPSRCYYCSFPGAVLRDYGKDMTPFLNSLFLEMEAIGNTLREQHMAVETVYIGGGTPTVLSREDMHRLFLLLHKDFISAKTVEITVEAGRPDTLTPEKLDLMKEAGVQRVCINPQTMHDSTLQYIGRNHDQKGVVKAYNWAREAGLEKINMDLIAGLPGEGLEEITYTAERVLQLGPDNITVHTLARKKGSLMAREEEYDGGQARTRAIQQAIEQCSRLFRGGGYLPYYLYRQKYMQASMENTGYALAGSFCLYNIHMIEERQTIIGMGGGAASKFINSRDWSLSSSYNPKNPQAYSMGLEKLIKRKVDNLQALN